MARSNMCVFLARLCIRSKKIPKTKLSKLGVRTRRLSFRKPLPWINVTFLPKSQPTHLLFLHLQCSPPLNLSSAKKKNCGFHSLRHAPGLCSDLSSPSEKKKSRDFFLSFRLYESKTLDA